MLDKDRFIEIVIKNIPIDGDPHVELSEFFAKDYVIEMLDGDGVLGYVVEDDYIDWHYLFDDGKFSNRKRAAILAKSFDKPVMYTGVKDNYPNNSTTVHPNVYQLNIQE
jgi:hypothetical protein